MTAEIDELTQLAYEGGEPLTTTPTVGVFPSAPVFATKAGVPVDFAEAVVNGVHTSPAMAGKVFERAGARMSAMWHLAVDHESVGPVYSEMRTQHDGPVVISQDLTVFDITKDAASVQIDSADAEGVVYAHGGVAGGHSST